MPNDKEPPTRNWRKRVSYYVPVTAWVPGYSWSLYVLSQFTRSHLGVESGVISASRTDSHGIFSWILVLVATLWLG